MKKVIAVQDDSCHWYVIPARLKSKWNELTEIMESSSSDSEEYDLAESEFIMMFDSYRTGGDLNNIQLYAKLNEQP
jgi:hypothetical protein